MDNVKFFYMVKNAIQLGFDGRSYHVDIPDGECHIVYMEQTLCGKSREKGKRHDGRRAITVAKRPAGVKLCEDCQKKYKVNGQLDWHRWTKNVAT